MLYQDTGYILDDAISDYRIIIGNLPVLICYAVFCFLRDKFKTSNFESYASLNVASDALVAPFDVVALRFREFQR